MARRKGQTVEKYGNGSLVQRRPGVWLYRERIDGVQRSTVIGSNAEPLTEKQARKRVPESSAALRERWTRAAAQDEGEKAAHTFGQVLDAWLSYGRTARGVEWAPKTAHEAHREVESRIRPTLGDRPVRDLTADDLENAYTEWAKTVGDSTIHRAASLVSSALTFALRRGWVTSNVARVAVAPAAPPSEAVPATREQIRKLLAAAEQVGLDMPKVIILMAVTGARPEEVAALRWENIDLRKGIIIERTATSPKAGHGVIVKATKTGTRRVVPLQGANRDAVRAVLGQPGPAHTYVIGGGEEPVRPQILTDRFDKVRGRAHIRKGLTLYSLRHAWATRMLEEGVPVHDVAQLGGWKSVAMVLRVYGHAVPDKHPHWAAKVEMV